MKYRQLVLYFGKQNKFKKELKTLNRLAKEHTDGSVSKYVMEHLLLPHLRENQK